MANGCFETVELRRTRPLIRPGLPVAIYATTPAAALVATWQIDYIEAGTPHDVWESVASKAAVTPMRYNDYSKAWASRMRSTCHPYRCWTSR
jgi:predicted transcriptional regulator